MSLECGECERDLRGGHDSTCSRYARYLCPACDTELIGDGGGEWPFTCPACQREFWARDTMKIDRPNTQQRDGRS